MTKITLEKLSEILGFSTNTIRTWLGNYRFAPYRLSHYYQYSNGFIESLVDYLEMKGYYKASENLKQYVRNFNVPASAKQSIQKGG